MISLSNVSFRYGDRTPWALKDITLQAVNSLVILGPSGAGKSTLLRLIGGYLVPGEGSLTVDGEPPSRHPLAVREWIGYVPQENDLPRELTLREFLRELTLIDARGGTAEAIVGEIVERLNLEGATERRLKHFSGGMKRRALLASALIRPCRLLLIDEPTAGLDPDEQATILTTIHSLSESCQVVMTTQILQDALALPAKTILLKAGRMAIETSVPELAEAARGRVFAVQGSEELEPSQLWMPTAEGDRVRVLSESPSSRWSELSPTIEDGYLWLLREGGARRES